MFQKPCNLSRAATYYGGLGGGGGGEGGGGGQGWYPQSGASVGQQSSGFFNPPGDTSGGPLNTDFPNSGNYHAGSMFRQPSGEVPILQNWFNRQIGNYGDFRDADRLLGPATTGALDFWKQLPDMLAQFPGFQKEISGDQSQIQGYQGQLGDLFQQLGGMIPGIQRQISRDQNQLTNIQRGLPGQFAGYQNQLGQYSNQIGGLAPEYQKFLGPGSALSAAYGGPSGIGAVLRSQGALTQDQTNAAVQQARAAASASGSVHDPSATIQEYESRQGARDARFNQALAQSQAVEGQQAGAVQGLQNIYGQQAGITGQRAGLTQALTGLQSGLIGQRAGLTGLGTQLVSGLIGQQGGLAQSGAGLSAMLAGLTGQKAGLLGQEQALQTGGLNQLLGVGNAAVSQYGGLTNPILSYLGNLFGGNQNAAIQQAQINAQQQAAGDSKKAGGTSAIGSIAAAAIPAIIGL